MTRWNGAHWVGQNLDYDDVRSRFIRALRRRKVPDASLFTPYWRSDFVNWLIYEATLGPCGASVESITPDFVTFEANCSGVQNEGICLVATFVIPTSEFTRPQLKQMVHDFEYYPCEENPDQQAGDADSVTAVVTYGPFDKTEYVTELEWWYDGSYDERGSDGSEEEMV